MKRSLRYWPIRGILALLLTVAIVDAASAEGAVRKLFNLSTVSEELQEIVPGQLAMKFWHGDDISVGVFRMTRSETGHFPGKVNTHGEEVAICTKGQLEMLIEGETYRFGEGQLLIIPPYVPHTGTCLSDDCTLVSWFTPNRIEEWGPEGNEDPELRFLDDAKK
jgi:mannose-6-phosphate isomerase-like protein (cupin superfamily)